MQHKYNVSEFYMLLKLGIWRSGAVNFWGQADIVPAWNRFLHSGDLTIHYNASSLIRKHLDTGVYLLDLFYAGKDPVQGTNVYQLIVAVCRNDMTHLEALYNIQVSNNIPAGDFFSALGRHDLVLDHFRVQRRYPAVYQKRVRTSLGRNIPIGSRFIQPR